MTSPNLFFLLYKVQLITGLKNLQRNPTRLNGEIGTLGQHQTYICMGFEPTEQSEMWEDKVLHRYGLVRDLLTALNTHAEERGIIMNPYRNDHQGSSPRWRRYAYACLADLQLSSSDFCEGSVCNQVVGKAVKTLTAEAVPILGPPLFTLISQSSLTAGKLPENWGPSPEGLAHAFDLAWKLPDALTNAQGSALSFAPLVALAEQAVCGRVSEAVRDPLRSQGCRL